MNCPSGGKERSRPPDDEEDYGEPIERIPWEARVPARPVPVPVEKRGRMKVPDEVLYFREAVAIRALLEIFRMRSWGDQGEVVKEVQKVQGKTGIPRIRAGGVRGVGMNLRQKDPIGVQPAVREVAPSHEELDDWVAGVVWKRLEEERQGSAGEDLGYNYDVGPQW